MTIVHFSGVNYIFGWGLGVSYKSDYVRRNLSRVKWYPLASENLLELLFNLPRSVTRVTSWLVNSSLEVK